MVCCCIVSLWFTGLEDGELGQGAPQPRVKPQLVCYRRSHRPFQSTGVWLSGSLPDSLYQHPSAPSSKCIKYFQHNTFSSSGWCLAWRREKIKMKSPKSQALLLPEFFFFFLAFSLEQECIQHTSLQSSPSTILPIEASKGLGE